MTGVHRESCLLDPTTGDSNISVLFTENFPSTQNSRKTTFYPNRGYLPVRWTKGDYYLVDLLKHDSKSETGRLL